VSDSTAKSELESFVIDNPQLDDLEALIAKFNIFEAIGAVRQELRHSDFLAFLLNPSEKHGLDDRFLKRFLIGVLSTADEPPISPITINTTDLSNASVERESQNIDILIHDTESGLVCVIENKIFTGEHSDQLSRYLRQVETRVPNAAALIPVYLTPDGTPPIDEDSLYIAFSYGELSEILEKVRQTQETMLGADVNTLIQHYVTMLRRHIVSDSDIALLCQQIYRTHKAAIDLIIEHMPDLRLEIAEYLSGLVSETPRLAVVRYSKSRVRFVVREWEEIPEFNLGVGWANTSATIALEFSNTASQLNLHLYLGPVSPDHEYVREAIFAYAAANRDVFKGCRPDLSPIWSQLYKLPFLRSRDYEDASLEDLAHIIDRKWRTFLTDILPQLHEHLRQINFG
jgi:hypothetical protein